MPMYNIIKRGMRLPGIGKIRKGEQVPVIDKETGLPKKSRGEIVMRPVERPHFVFSIDKTQEAGVWDVLKNAYGTKEICELNVYLAMPDANSNFSFFMEAYNANQRVAVSDERTVTYLFDVDTNTTLIKDGVIVAHSPKPNSPSGKLVNHLPIGAELPYSPDMVLAQSKTSEKAITFKAVGRLTVLISELRRAETFTVMTGGYWYDIPQIWTTIEMIDQICQATGRAASTIPLKLRRTEREHTYTAEDGSKKKRVYHDLELVIRTDIVAQLLAFYENAPFTFGLASGNQSQPTLPELNAGPEPVEAYDDSDTGPDAEEMDTPAPATASRNQPLPALPVPASDPNDEQVDPFSEASVKWAAKQWNIDTQHAAQELGKMLKAGRISNPMGKKALKAAVQNAG